LPTISEWWYVPEPTQQRLRRIGKLEHAEGGGDAEEIAQDEEQAQCRDGRARGGRQARPDELDKAGCVAVTEQRE
jgi:hypothetical protein